MIKWLRSRRERRASIEDPRTPLSGAHLLKAFGRWLSTGSGVDVNSVTALNAAPLFQGINLISGDVARIPVSVLKRQDNGGKEVDPTHKAHRLIRRKPCPEMTALHLKRTLMVHALLRGSGYAYIYRLESGAPDELVPLLPESTYPIRVDGTLWYTTSVGGKQRVLAPENVFHLRGVSSNGITGYSVLDLAKESIGLTLAAQQYASNFFGGGAQAAGFIEYPGKLGDTEYENIKKSISEQHTGLGKQHKFLILEEGMKFNPTTLTNDQSQFLQTREFQREEIASWLNMPASRLGVSKARTWASLEQDNQAYLDSTLDPWLIAFEEECWDKLLTEEEKANDSHIVEFNRNALMRADSAGRSAYYHNGLIDGWMNRDEVRARENLPAIPNGEGQKFYTPLNMGLTGSIADKKNGRSQARQRAIEQRQRQLAEVHRELLIDAAGRVVKRVAGQARDMAKGKNNRADTAKFCGWLDDLDGLRQWAEAQMAPAARAANAATGADTAALAGRLMRDIEDRLQEVADTATPDELLARVDELMQELESTAAVELAEQVLPSPAKAAAA